MSSQLIHPILSHFQIDHGDLTEQKALRERLQCRSFDWYIKTIYPEQFIPSEALAVGEVRLRYIQIVV